MTRHIHWEILITCNDLICQDAEGSSTKCNDECSKFTDSMTGCGVYIVHCCTLLYTAVHWCTQVSTCCTPGRRASPGRCC